MSTIRIVRHVLHIDHPMAAICLHDCRLLTKLVTNTILPLANVNPLAVYPLLRCCVKSSPPQLAIIGKFGRIQGLFHHLLSIDIMGRVAELSESDFDTMLQAEVPVLVDFWSPTCAPCRTLVPILEELAEENEGDATIVKINTADYPALVTRFGIDTLPTLLFFYQGRVVERMTGIQSKHKIQSALDEIE